MQRHMLTLYEFGSFTSSLIKMKKLYGFKCDVCYIMNTGFQFCFISANLAKNVQIYFLVHKT